MHDVLAKSTYFWNTPRKDSNAIMHAARVVNQGLAHQVSAYISTLYTPQILLTA